MPVEVRLWEVQQGDVLKQVKPSKLDLEDRIEKWLEQDISMIGDDLLVIGRQVNTDFGGTIDLLCLHRSGDLVIVELKRDKTPRDITAQILEYGAWASGLSNEDVTEIAERHLGDRGSLEAVFRERLKAEFPDVLNERHRMLIVAAEIDDKSERIVKYLSGTYGVWINAVTFQYFRDEQSQELVARVFLIDLGQIEHDAGKARSKRKPPLTIEDLERSAEEKDVGDLFSRLHEELGSLFDRTVTTRSSLAFVGNLEGHYVTMFSLLPEKSNAQDGLYFQAYSHRLASYFNTDEAAVRSLLPKTAKEWKYYKGASRDYWGYAGFFQAGEDIERLVANLRRLKDSG